LEKINTNTEVNKQKPRAPESFKNILKHKYVYNRNLLIPLK